MKTKFSLLKFTTYASSEGVLWHWNLFMLVKSPSCMRSHKKVLIWTTPMPNLVKGKTNNPIAPTNNNVIHALYWEGSIVTITKASHEASQRGLNTNYSITHFWSQQLEKFLVLLSRGTNTITNNQIQLLLI